MKMLQIDKVQPSIMEPMDAIVTLKDDINRPDVVNDADFKSITLATITSDEYTVQDQSSTKASILLMDSNDYLRIPTPELFCKALRCTDNEKIKVISIFGNTGDGKSHTMNHVFFGGENVFHTSAEQSSCTLGVYAAMQHDMGVLCLDTEGLLGTTTQTGQHIRTRMLLKILAISDIVIYRTRSERLHSDMFEFLGTASYVFSKYFADALQSLAIPGTAKKLGPAVIIFHETRHTKPLESSVEESAEDKLREQFALQNRETNAFSSLRYVGIRTQSQQATNYSELINVIRTEVENTTVRSPRHANVIFKAMKALNMKFSGDIVVESINPFPEQYFTCPVQCESCNRRCQRSMGHGVDGENHWNKHPCNYQHQYENKVYLCKICYNSGKEIRVKFSTQAHNESSWYGLAQYAWKGPVIECPHCGEIYRARQYWYGNKSPELTAVRSEIVHVWKGGNILAKGPTHSAQMVIDGVSYISEALTSISAQPTKVLTDWLADRVAPSYWKPNHEITRCYACKKNFEKTGLTKHHCRGCGEGFCQACSQHKMPVPARGWTEDVRVCNECREQLMKKDSIVPGPPPQNDEADILLRKYGETIYNTISSVASVAFEYPKEIIKDSARPSYWIPDAEAPNCFICYVPFGTAEELELARTSKLHEAANTTNNTITTTTQSAATGATITNTANNMPVGTGTTGSAAVVPSTSTISSSPVSTTTTTAVAKETTKRIDVTTNVNRITNANAAPPNGDCKRHHCRKCGKAVCENCSRTRRPVPERGWQTDVRVCDACKCVEREANNDVKAKAE